MITPSLNDLVAKAQAISENKPTAYVFLGKEKIKGVTMLCPNTTFKTKVNSMKDTDANPTICTLVILDNIEDLIDHIIFITDRVTVLNFWFNRTSTTTTKYLVEYSFFGFKDLCLAFLAFSLIEKLPQMEMIIDKIKMCQNSDENGRIIVTDSGPYTYIVLDTLLKFPELINTLFNYKFVKW